MHPKSGKSLIAITILTAVTLAFARRPEGWSAYPIFDNGIFFWSVETPGGPAAYSGRLILHEASASLYVWQGYSVTPNETTTLHSFARPGCFLETFAIPLVCAYRLTAERVIGAVRSEDANKLWRGQVYLLWVTMVRR